MTTTALTSEPFRNWQSRAVSSELLTDVVTEPGLGLQGRQVLLACAGNRGQRNRLIEGDKPAVMGNREGE